MTKEYMGDGLYIQEGSCKDQVVLTTENGISTTNTIYLDYEMIKYIHRYALKPIKESQ